MAVYFPSYEFKGKLRATPSYWHHVCGNTSTYPDQFARWSDTAKPMFKDRWWRHQMKTFSTLPGYWSFVQEIHRSPVKSLHKSQRRGALNFSLICAWTSSWVNYRDAGDVGRHRAHYEDTVMQGKTHQNTRQLLFCGHNIYKSCWFYLAWKITLLLRSVCKVVFFARFHCTSVLV